MTWAGDAIWWHVYPLGFAGAPIRPASDSERSLTHHLARFSGWLDHVVGLGLNGLLLGPIFDSTTHGYDTVDFFTIDPRLGDDTDFDTLIAHAHQSGIRVALDGVFNHVGSQHPLYLAALSSPDAPENALFRIDWSDGTPRAADFEGHGHLVAFNHDSAPVEDLVVDVMTYWLRRGIDGWRLDAAYAVPAEFWARVLPRVRAEFPDAWLLGEMIHGDYAAYVAASGIDTVTQYELWKAIWSSLRDENFYELAHALERHDALQEHFRPQTFIGNHDTTRIATQVGRDKAVLAAAILFTVGGIPSVYAGDEDGFTGLKRDAEGGDDDVRPPFPDSPRELSHLGEPIRSAYAALIALRRRYHWLTDARVRVIELSNERFVYEVVGPDATLTVTLDAPAATASIADTDDVLWTWTP